MYRRKSTSHIVDGEKEKLHLELEHIPFPSYTEPPVLQLAAKAVQSPPRHGVARFYLGCTGSGSGTGIWWYMNAKPWSNQPSETSLLLIILAIEGEECEM
jgi:hypothetical protein